MSNNADTSQWAVLLITAIVLILSTFVGSIVARKWRKKSIKELRAILASTNRGLYSSAIGELARRGLDVTPYIPMMVEMLRSNSKGERLFGDHMAAAAFPKVFRQVLKERSDRSTVHIRLAETLLSQVADCNVQSSDLKKSSFAQTQTPSKANEETFTVGHVQSGGVPVADGAGTLQIFTEKDNRGTRQETVDQANAYWVWRMTSRKKDPYVLYEFATEAEARAALLDVPVIHLAEDTQKLISTEVLVFGYYPNDQGKYEAFICGHDLSHELWEHAKTSFDKHGGIRKNALEPQRGGTTQFSAKSQQLGKVQFVREERQDRGVATMLYKIHRAPDAASAKAFLAEHPVNQQFIYIVVETPDGNYCRDIQGIYKE